MIYCKRFDDHGQCFEGGVSAVDELSVENGRRHNQADQFVQDQRKELDHRLRFGVGQLADAVPGIFLKIFNNSVTNFVWTKYLILRLDSMLDSPMCGTIRFSSSAEQMLRNRSRKRSSVWTEVWASMYKLKMPLWLSTQRVPGSITSGLMYR